MSVYLWGVWESGQGRMCGKERGGWRPRGKHSCLYKQYELCCVSPEYSTEVFLQGNCLCFVGSWWYLPGAIIRESLEITEVDPTRGFSVLVCHVVPCFSAAFCHSTPWSGNTGHCSHRTDVTAGGKKTRLWGDRLIGKHLWPLLPEEWHFGRTVIASPLCYLLGTSFPLIILISQRSYHLALT